MTSQFIPKPYKQRLVGIDLFRGAAAYAVCLIHADAVMTFSNFSVDKWVIVLTQLSRFAVPFFLAVSFYFMTNKLYVKGNHFSFFDNFKIRFTRLIVPYLFWSILYIALRSFQALNTSDKFKYLFQDPIRLIFLGGAAFHLYFLPLLFLGSFLIILAQYLVQKRIKAMTIFMFLLVSIIIYEVLIISNNDFELGTYCFDKISSCSVAFQGLTATWLPNGSVNQFLRVFLVAISWLIQCLPYIFMSMLLNHPTIQHQIFQYGKKYLNILIVLLISVSLLAIFNRFEVIYFPQSLYEVSIALLFLLIGVVISRNWKNNPLIENLGVCSFGIYLLHHLALIPYTNIIASLSNEFLEISPALIVLILSILSFLTSWIITSMLIGKKPISKFLFGI